MPWPTWQESLIAALLSGVAILVLRRTRPSRFTNVGLQASTEFAILAALYSIWRMARLLPLYQSGGARSRALDIVEVQRTLWWPDELVLQTPKGTEVIPNDFVLALTGYQPNFEFLIAAGIHLSNDEKKLPDYNPETMETNVPGLYLAGVICGGMETHKWFIENSREHAQIILRDICSKKVTGDTAHQPS